MSESTAYRLRVRKLAVEAVDNMWRQGEENAPVGTDLVSSYNMVEVIKQYASIAEAENHPRDSFSEEIFERACDAVKPFVSNRSEEDLAMSLLKPEDDISVEAARNFARGVVQKVLSKAIA
jgi:hypothetical protein